MTTTATKKKTLALTTLAHNTGMLLATFASSLGLTVQAVQGEQSHWKISKKGSKSHVNLFVLDQVALGLPSVYDEEYGITLPADDLVTGYDNIVRALFEMV